jgi:hypothetical protein
MEPIGGTAAAVGRSRIAAISHDTNPIDRQRDPTTASFLFKNFKLKSMITSQRTIQTDALITYTAHRQLQTWSTLTVQQDYVVLEFMV